MSTLDRWAASTGTPAFAKMALLFLPGDHAQGAVRASSAIKRSRSATAVTSDGVPLLVVNPDPNSLTPICTAGHSAIAEITTGVDPRTMAINLAGRAHVASRRGDSFSVIDHVTASR